MVRKTADPGPGRCTLLLDGPIAWESEPDNPLSLARRATSYLRGERCRDVRILGRLWRTGDGIDAWGRCGAGPGTPGPARLGLLRGRRGRGADTRGQPRGVRPGAAAALRT